MHEMEHFYQDEEQLFRQKSRAEWVRASDRNTTFFHSYFKERSNKNCIQSLKLEDGSQMFEVDQLKQASVEFFQNLLQQCPSSPPLDQ